MKVKSLSQAYKITGKLSLPSKAANNFAVPRRFLYNSFRVTIRQSTLSRRSILVAILGVSILIPAYNSTITKRPLSGTQPPIPNTPDSVSTETEKEKEKQAQLVTTEMAANQFSTPYTATFSTPMHCTDCTSSIASALSSLSGIHSTSFSLPEEIVTITGTTPPSAIIAAIEETGRTAILRGSGKSDSAAVCILEIPPPLAAPSSSSPQSQSQPQQSDSLTDSSLTPVRGLLRLIDLSSTQTTIPTTTLLDLSLSNLPPTHSGTWRVSIRSTGDITRGRASMGPIWRGEAGDREGVLGEVKVGKDGRGGFVKAVQGWRVWEVVGRGLLVEFVNNDDDGDGRNRNGDVNVNKNEDTDKDEEGTVMGVIARSAGIWENAKVVCACSGKTVWEEREEMVDKGMV